MAPDRRNRPGSIVPGLDEKHRFGGARAYVVVHAPFLEERFGNGEGGAERSDHHQDGLPIASAYAGFFVDRKEQGLARQGAIGRTRRILMRYLVRISFPSRVSRSS
ncbi:hypothetical protein [Halomonas denitrificans]|nr:hypothetical protein [Halomonas denitrificans]